MKLASLFIRRSPVVQLFHILRYVLAVVGNPLQVDKHLKEGGAGLSPADPLVETLKVSFPPLSHFNVDSLLPPKNLLNFQVISFGYQEGSILHIRKNQLVDLIQLNFSAFRKFQVALVLFGQRYPAISLRRLSTTASTYTRPLLCVMRNVL